MDEKKSIVQVSDSCVILTLDKPRELRLSHKAMKKFSALTGCRLSEFDGAIDDYDNMTMALCLMMQDEDPDLTVEKVDELISVAERSNGLRIKDLIEAASAAIKVAFGGDEDEDAGKEEGKKTDKEGEKDPLPEIAGDGVTA